MIGHLTVAPATPVRLVLTGMVMVFACDFVSSDVFGGQVSPPDDYDADQGRAVNDSFSGIWAFCNSINDSTYLISLPSKVNATKFIIIVAQK